MELFFESKITSINRGIYIQKIYDPIQTHAVYGITKEDLDKVKKVLTDYKCSRFRTVKTRTNFIILCFKSLEIKTIQVNETDLKNNYRVFINKKEVSVIKFPSSNPYLKNLNLEQIAEIEVKRVLES